MRTGPAHQLPGPRAHPATQHAIGQGLHSTRRLVEQRRPPARLTGLRPGPCRKRQGRPPTPAGCVPAPSPSCLPKPAQTDALSPRSHRRGSARPVAAEPPSLPMDEALAEGHPPHQPADAPRRGTRVAARPEARSRPSLPGPPLRGPWSRSQRQRRRRPAAPRAGRLCCQPLPGPPALSARPSPDAARRPSPAAAAWDARAQTSGPWPRQAARPRRRPPGPGPVRTMRPPHQERHPLRCRALARGQENLPPAGWRLKWKAVVGRGSLSSCSAQNPVRYRARQAQRACQRAALRTSAGRRQRRKALGRLTKGEMRRSRPAIGRPRARNLFPRAREVPSLRRTCPSPPGLHVQPRLRSAP